MALNGWIRLNRSLLDWEWYEDLKTRVVFIHLLLIANFSETTYKGYKLMPGDCVCGYQALSEAVGLTVKEVRTAFEHLKSTGDIVVKTTNKFSVVTICNWAKYQDVELEFDDDDDGQAKGKQNGRQRASKTASKKTAETLENTGVQDSEKSERASKTAAKGQANGQQKGNTVTINNINNKHIIYIVGLLNEKAGTHYKPTSAKTKRLITARLNEGFEVSDFEKVIDNKCSDWMGTEWEQYLRPETLFGTKFENYLNAPKRRKVTAYDNNSDRSDNPEGYDKLFSW